jgi:cobalamin synthase
MIDEPTSMIAAVAIAIIVILASAICVLCIWGFLVPSRLLGFVRRFFDTRGGLTVAVAVRLLLGASLIVAAPSSRFPRFFEFVGWIALIAAVALLFAGRRIVDRLLGWAERLPFALTRLWLIFGLAFGAFLIYGSV